MLSWPRRICKRGTHVLLANCSVSIEKPNVCSHFFTLKISINFTQENGCVDPVSFLDLLEESRKNQMRQITLSHDPNVIKDEIKTLGSREKSLVFGSSYAAPNYETDWIRSKINFGGPINATDQFGVQIYGSSQEKRLQQLAKFRAFIVDGYLQILRDAATDEMDVLYYEPTLASYEIMEMIQDDIWLSFGAGIFVWVVLTLKMRSSFLGTFGLLSIAFAYPCAVFIYHGVLRVQVYTGINMMVIFLLLGLGSNDIYVFHTAWKQSVIAVDKALMATHSDWLLGRMTWCWRRSMVSISVTSATSFAAFLIATTSPVPVASRFSLMAAAMVFCQFVFISVYFPTALLLWDRYFADSCCCKRAEDAPDHPNKDITSTTRVRQPHTFSIRKMSFQKDRTLPSSNSSGRSDRQFATSVSPQPMPHSRPSPNRRSSLSRNMSSRQGSPDSASYNRRHLGTSSARNTPRGSPFAARSRLSGSQRRMDLSPVRRSLIDSANEIMKSSPQRSPGGINWKALRPPEPFPPPPPLPSPPIRSPHFSPLYSVVTVALQDADRNSNKPLCPDFSIDVEPSYSPGQCEQTKRGLHALPVPSAPPPKLPHPAPPENNPNDTTNLAASDLDVPSGSNFRKSRTSQSQRKDYLSPEPPNSRVRRRSKSRDNNSKRKSYSSQKEKSKRDAKGNERNGDNEQEKKGNKCRRSNSLKPPAKRTTSGKTSSRTTSAKTSPQIPSRRARQHKKQSKKSSEDVSNVLPDRTSLNSQQDRTSGVQLAEQNNTNPNRDNNTEKSNSASRGKSSPRSGTHLTIYFPPQLPLLFLFYFST